MNKSRLTQYHAPFLFKPIAVVYIVLVHNTKLSAKNPWVWKKIHIHVQAVIWMTVPLEDEPQSTNTDLDHTSLQILTLTCGLDG